MNINFEKIKEIYGEDTIELLNDNMDDVIYNLSYLINIGIDDVCEVLECYPLMFICDRDEFKNQIDKLIFNLGDDYIEKLENDLGLWGEVI